MLAIKPTDERKYRNIVWECKCDCGNICYVASSLLISGNTVSCGCLKSKGENRIEQVLQELCIDFDREKTFSDCKNPKTNTLLRFDFYLPDYNICIEYDGEQHFKYRETGWNTKEYLKEVQYRDKIKDEYCKNNNKLIRISFLDYNKINKEYILSRVDD